MIPQKVACVKEKAPGMLRTRRLSKNLQEVSEGPQAL